MTTVYMYVLRTSCEAPDSLINSNTSHAHFSKTKCQYNQYNLYKIAAYKLQRIK